MALELKPATTDVVVLCGGKGTRLGGLTKNTPKPLLPIGEHPFLFHLLCRMRKEGFGRFIITTHYLAEKFQAFLSKYSDFLRDTILVPEEEPLGTGGALRNAAMYIQSEAFIGMNGDSYISQPLVPVVESHARMGASFTMVAARAENVLGGAESKGALDIGMQNRIIGFSPSGRSRGWINAGIYVLDRTMVSSWPSGRYDLEGNLMTLLGPAAGRVFCSEVRLLDIGTPQCYAKADEELSLFDLRNP